MAIIRRRCYWCGERGNGSISNEIAVSAGAARHQLDGICISVYSDQFARLEAFTSKRFLFGFGIQMSVFRCCFMARVLRV